MRCAAPGRIRGSHPLFPRRIAAIIGCARLPHFSGLMRTACPLVTVSASDSQLTSLLGGPHGAADHLPAERVGWAQG